jgi:hypothetical protein
MVLQARNYVEEEARIVHLILTVIDLILNVTVHSLHNLKY